MDLLLQMIPIVVGALDLTASFRSFCCPNSDLNRLVMDYLVIEGYKDAADCFSKESGLKPFVDSDSILNRMIIRGAIQRGDIDDAIGRVNELDPEVRFHFITAAASTTSMILSTPHRPRHFE